VSQVAPASTPHPAPAPGPGSPSFADRIADPGPLGLAGFAGTTFFSGVVNAGLLSQTVGAGILGLAFFYGGLAQLLAGMWEFTKGNTFGAVAFSSYGAFWLSYWYLVTTAVPAMAKGGASADNISHAVAVYLLVWAIFTGYMFIASLRTTGAVAAVFLFLFLAFVVLFIANLAPSSTGILKVAGWVELVTAVTAWYASFAAVTNFTNKRTVFPVFPR
jgi:succinate-acetate transporter protein